MKRKHITQIGVNILGFPIYHETTIYQGENNYTGKTEFSYYSNLITQR